MQKGVFYDNVTDDWLSQQSHDQKTPNHKQKSGAFRYPLVTVSGAHRAHSRHKVFCNIACNTALRQAHQPRG